MHKSTKHITHAYEAFQNITNLNSIGLAAVIILGLIIIFAPRRHSVTPMFIMASFVSSMQKVVIPGLNLDFQLLRILILIAFFRILLRSEWRGFQLKPFDAFFFAWAFSNAILNTILMGTGSAAINRAGFLFDAIGFYLIFRILVRSVEEVSGIIRGIILLSIPVAGAFLVERATGHNMFAVFGGVNAITWVRAGVLRCQGAFSHPIMAGAFWASLIPWMASRFSLGSGEKFLAVIGVFCGLIIVITTSSSTPLLAILAGTGMVFLYPFRRHLYLFFIGAILLAVMLSIIMWSPVWNIISFLNITPGATGMHRVLILNNFVKHFDEWWLLGTQSTSQWGRQMFDITNQYLIEGAKGGLLTMVLFILMLVMAFRELGKFRAYAEHNRYLRYLGWGLTISLFMNSLMFMAVTYFGQIIFMWYLLLAIIATITPGKGSAALASEPGAAEDLEKPEDYYSNQPWQVNSIEANLEANPWQKS